MTTVDPAGGQQPHFPHLYYASLPVAPPTVEPAPPPSIPSRTGPFLEAFALYLCGQIALSIAITLIFKRGGLELEWVMLLLLPVAFFWPLWRGVSWSELRRGLGWHRGRGVFREIGAGLAGYVGVLPIFAVGILLTLLLNRLAHSTATHPIQEQIGEGFWNHVQVYALACVWAPIVEETMFRGALFHHLRQRWGWAASAGLVALLFAAIHPQGWTAIPALGSLAVGFAALREWRGSIIAPITAHALNNFIVSTVMILVMG